jgi:hypothetical protein
MADVDGLEDEAFTLPAGVHRLELVFGGVRNGFHVQVYSGRKPRASGTLAGTQAATQAATRAATAKEKAGKARGEACRDGRAWDSITVQLRDRGAFQVERTEEDTYYSAREHTILSDTLYFRDAALGWTAVAHMRSTRPACVNDDDVYDEYIYGHCGNFEAYFSPQGDFVEAKKAPGQLVFRHVTPVRAEQLPLAQLRALAVLDREMKARRVHLRDLCRRFGANAFDDEALEESLRALDGMTEADIIEVWDRYKGDVGKLQGGGVV